MIDSFKESIWTFNENGAFRIKFGPNLSPAMEEIIFLDNTLWRFDNSLNEIQIGTKEDDYNHLVISPMQTPMGMNVYFSDTTIYLTFKKNK